MIKQFAKVEISGIVAASPTIEFKQSGKALLRMAVFVNQGEEADYINLIAWENKAKYIVDRIEKGDSIYVECFIRARFYGEENNRKYGIEFIVNEVLAYEKKQVKESPTNE